MPNVPPNADALIDYALSKIPRRKEFYFYIELNLHLQDFILQELDRGDREGRSECF